MKLSVFASLVLPLIFFASVVHAQPSQNQLRTGAYGNSLLIAVNSQEKSITGKFGSSGGYLASEGWDCNFYFSGKIQADGSAKIVAVSVGLNEDKVRTSSIGTLITAKQIDAVTIKLSDEVSGCARGEDFFDKDPAPRGFNELRASLEPQELIERKDGIEYRIVSNKRSYFYDTALSIDHRKAYLTCGDIVMVTAKDKATDRVKAIYVRKKKNTVGWLSQKDLLGIGEELRCR